MSADAPNELPLVERVCLWQVECLIGHDAALPVAPTPLPEVDKEASLAPDVPAAVSIQQDPSPSLPEIPTEPLLPKTPVKTITKTPEEKLAAKMAPIEPPAAKSSEECLVDVDKYKAAPVAQPVLSDTILVPADDINFDDELLQPQKTLGSPVVEEKKVFSKSAAKVLPDVGLNQDVESAVGPITERELKQEFGGMLGQEEPSSPARVVVEYRVPFTALLSLLLLTLLLSAVLALLIVQLYNVPVPDVMIKILEKIKG